MSETDWPATRLVMEAARQFPDSSQELDAFLQDAMRMSSVYFAVADRARLSTDDYMRAGFPTVAKLMTEIPFPPQALYVLGERVAEDFMSGRVDVAELKKFSDWARVAAAKIRPVIQDVREGKGNYSLDKTGGGVPKSLSDVLNLEVLAQLISKYTDDEGVSQTTFMQRELINGMIVDDVSLLVRVPKAPLPQ